MIARYVCVCNTCGAIFDEPEKKKGRFGGLIEICPKCGHSFTRKRMP